MTLNSTIDSAKDYLAEGHEAAQEKIAGLTNTARDAAQQAGTRAAESIDAAGASVRSAVKKGADITGEFVDKNGPKLAEAGCKARNSVATSVSSARSALSRNPALGILAGIGIGLVVAFTMRRK